MCGAVVTEQIFVLPGFGKLTLDAVFTRDYPVIEGVVLLTPSATCSSTSWSTSCTRCSTRGSASPGRSMSASLSTVAGVEPRGSR